MPFLSKILILFMIGVFSVASASDVFAAKKEMVFVTNKYRDSPDAMFLELVYTEALKRLGKRFVYKQIPAARSSMMANRGIVDGELSRIESYGVKHPGLVRVEEPHWVSSFVAAAVDKSIKLDGWESLRGTSYTVNYERGIKGSETALPKVVALERLEAVNSITYGLRKVVAGRTDIFVGTEMNILSALKTEEFEEANVRIVGTMSCFTAHLYLHKEHAELAPKISDALKNMKAEGLFEKYQKVSGLSEFLGHPCVFTE